DGALPGGGAAGAEPGVLFGDVDDDPLRGPGGTALVRRRARVIRDGKRTGRHRPGGHRGRGDLRGGGGRPGGGISPARGPAAERDGEDADTQEGAEGSAQPERRPCQHRAHAGPPTSEASRAGPGAGCRRPPIGRMFPVESEEIPLREQIVTALRGRRALIALDFDGTLAPIVRDPETSRPV